MASVSSTGMGPSAMRSASVGPSTSSRTSAFVRFFETVDARDVRMVQRREKLRLALELRVMSSVHLTHASFSDWRDDLIWAEVCSWGESHHYNLSVRAPRFNRAELADEGEEVSPRYIWSGKECMSIRLNDKY